MLRMHAFFGKSVGQKAVGTRFESVLAMTVPLGVPGQPRSCWTSSRITVDMHF